MSPGRSWVVWLSVVYAVSALGDEKGASPQVINGSSSGSLNGLSARDQKRCSILMISIFQSEN